jgi:hypothetical protein
MQPSCCVANQFSAEAVGLRIDGRRRRRSIPCSACGADSTCEDAEASLADGLDVTDRAVDNQADHVGEKSGKVWNLSALSPRE